MRKKYTNMLVSITMALGLTVGCTPTPPTEAEVKDKIVGRFCSFGEKDYQLTITDSTYYSIRRSPGVLQSQYKIREACDGSYKLVLEANRWLIRYNPDNDPDATVENCAGEQVLWTQQDGYLIGDEAVS